MSHNAHPLVDLLDISGDETSAINRFSYNCIDYYLYKNGLCVI